jgi:hypothetical protein
VSIGSIVVCSVCRAVALLHGFVFLRRPALKTDLWFALMAVGVAVRLTAMLSLLGIVDSSILLNYTFFG